MVVYCPPLVTDVTDCPTTRRQASPGIILPTARGNMRLLCAHYFLHKQIDQIYESPAYPLWLVNANHQKSIDLDGFVKFVMGRIGPPVVELQSL